MKYNEFIELTSLVDDDILLVHQASTSMLKKIKLSTLKQYVGVPVAQPSTLPTNYSLWLKPDQGITLDGTTVSAWADQSSNNYNATQSIKASQPLLINNELNGLPVLRFDGVDDFLLSNSGIGSLGARSIFVVVKIRAFSNYAGIFCQRSLSYLDWNSSDGLAISHNDVANQVSVDYAVNYLGSNPGTNAINLKAALPLNAWSILNLNIFDTTALIRINQNPSVTDTFQINHTTNQGGYVLSARGTDGNNSNGRQISLYAANDIAEVVCYNRALSGSEETAVKNYLNTKYQIY